MKTPSFAGFKVNDLVRAKASGMEGYVFEIGPKHLKVRWSKDAWAPFTKKEARELLEHREMLA